MAYDIFISYSKKDTSKIEHLREALSKTDIKYWIDDYIGGSKKWLKEIPVAIKSSKILLFVATQNSASSEWTQKEILYAQKLDKEIYPYKLTDFSFENCPELDFFFTNVQWRENIDDVIEDLLTMTGRKRLDSVNTESNIEQGDIVKDDVECKVKEDEVRKSDNGRFAKIEIEHKAKEKAERDAYLLSLPDYEFYRFYKNGKWGVMLKSTKEIVINPTYDFIGEWYNGLFVVRRGSKYGCINTVGEKIALLKYDRIDLVHNFIVVRLDNKCGVIDKTGKIIIPLIYDSIIIPSENCYDKDLILVQRDGKFGYVNDKGENIIALKYIEAFPFSEGLAAVRDNSGKMGYIDRTDKVIIPYRYEYAEPFREKLANVEYRGKYGFIDKEDNVAIPFNYRQAFGFSEGLAAVKLKRKWGFINRKGETVIPCKYDLALGYNNGIAKVKKRILGWEREFYIDKNGNRIE